MRTRAISALVTALATTALLTSCADKSSDDSSGSGDDGGANSALDGRTYLSTDVTTGGKPFALVAGTRVQLTFSGKFISASAGCNSMGGPATYGDGVLDVADNLGMTEIGCSAARMQQDNWLADVLTSKPAIRADGDTLTMTAGKTTIAFGDKKVVEPDAELTGTVWKLQSFGGAGDDASISSVPDGVESTISFTDNRVQIDFGCNSGGGDVAITASTITFSAILATTMACGDPKDEVEQVVAAGTTGEVNYTIDSDAMTLSNDAATLSYVAVD